MALLDILTSAAKPLTDLINNIIDKFSADASEKLKAQQDMAVEMNRHLEKVAEQAQAEIDSQLAAKQKELETVTGDLKSARETNMAIQNSSQSNWPAKWTPYLIAWMVTLVWSLFTLYIGAKAIGLVSNDKADLTGVLSLYSTVTAMFGVILYFYFGSSTGAKANGEAIRDMVKKQQ